MPIRKIDKPKKSWNRPICYHPDHNIPNMMVFEPGTYEHTCPGCGKVTTFTVPERDVLYAGDPKTIWAAPS